MFALRLNTGLYHSSTGCLLGIEHDYDESNPPHNCVKMEGKKFFLTKMCMKVYTFLLPTPYYVSLTVISGKFYSDVTGSGKFQRNLAHTIFPNVCNTRRSEKSCDKLIYTITFNLLLHLMCRYFKFLACICIYVCARPMNNTKWDDNEIKLFRALFQRKYREVFPSFK